MRIRIEVGDLTPAQAEYLATHLPIRAGVPDGATRVCLQVETPAGDHHVEMTPRSFMDLVSELETVGKAGRNPDVCQHGHRVKHTQPSFWRGADPIRTYEDGCQSFGPYPGLTDERVEYVNGAGHLEAGR